MTGAAWLAAIFGVIMIVAAVVAATRIIVALRTHKATDFEVDIHNVLMGVAMAGMLIPGLLIVTVGPSTTVWLIVWIVITAWFGVSVLRDAFRRTTGHRFTGHHLPHLVMSAAMIYMLAVMATGGMGSGSSMSDHSGMSGMGVGGGLVPFPTLDYAFVIFMVGYAVVVIDRLPRVAVVGTGDLQVVGQPHATATAKPLAPTIAALTNIVMAVTMGYMLTMMFA